MGGVYVTYVANVDKGQWHVRTLLRPFKAGNRWLISPRPNVEGNKLFSSSYTHMQLNSFSDHAESLNLTIIVDFLLWVIKNFKSALSEKMDISLHVIIHFLRLKGPNKEVHDNM